jgi:hypothetical protein
LLQDAISGEIGSLKDEVKENTVQEVRKALQANIEAIQRATKLLEKQSDTLTSVMKQKIRELEESKNSFFRYEVVPYPFQFRDKFFDTVRIHDLLLQHTGKDILLLVLSTL